MPLDTLSLWSTMILLRERGYRDRKGTVQQAVITLVKDVTFRAIAINRSRDLLALEEKNGAPQSLTN